MKILSILFAVLVSVGMVAGFRAWHTLKLRELGDRYETIDLINSYVLARTGYWALLALMVVLPVTVLCWMIFASTELPVVSILIVLVACFFGLFFFANTVRYMKRFFVGPNGMYGPVYLSMFVAESEDRFVLGWEHVEEISWDHDVGQRLYGMSVKVQPVGRWAKLMEPQTQRVYVLRNQVDELDHLLNKYWTEWRSSSSSPQS
jgi:hypothetical protein